MDVSAGWECGAVAVALVGENGLHPWVVGGGLGEIGGVGDDEDVVLGYGEVELEDVGAYGYAVLEGGDGVFGAVGAASAVSVDEDGLS